MISVITAVRDMGHSVLERQLNKLHDAIFKFALALLVTEIETFKGRNCMYIEPPTRRHRGVWKEGLINPIAIHFLLPRRK